MVRASPPGWLARTDSAAFKEPKNVLQPDADGSPAAANAMRSQPIRFDELIDQRPANLQPHRGFGDGHQFEVVNRIGGVHGKFSARQPFRYLTQLAVGDYFQRR
jgi:hypothetical protein